MTATAVARIPALVSFIGWYDLVMVGVIVGQMLSERETTPASKHYEKLWFLNRALASSGAVTQTPTQLPPSGARVELLAQHSVRLPQREGPFSSQDRPPHEPT